MTKAALAWIGGAAEPLRRERFARTAALLRLPAFFRGRHAADRVPAADHFGGRVKRF